MFTALTALASVDCGADEVVIPSVTAVEMAAIVVARVFSMRVGCGPTAQLPLPAVSVSQLSSVLANGGVLYIGCVPDAAFVFSDVVEGVQECAVAYRAMVTAGWCGQRCHVPPAVHASDGRGVIAAAVAMLQLHQTVAGGSCAPCRHTSPLGRCAV